MQFDSQPVLIGSLIKLRPLKSDDKVALFSAASDPRIWEQHPVSNRYQPAEFEKYFSEAIASGGALLVMDTQTNEVIGSSRYHGYSAGNSEVEIGWTFLIRSHWGGKYNGELKRLMLGHAFQSVKTVLFFIGPENKRSQHSIEKIGGVKNALPDEKGNVVYRIKITDYMKSQ